MTDILSITLEQLLKELKVLKEERKKKDHSMLKEQLTREWYTMGFKETEITSSLLYLKSPNYLSLRTNKCGETLKCGSPRVEKEELGNCEVYGLSLPCECHDLDGTLINSKEDFPNVSQKLHKDCGDNDYDFSFLYESHACEHCDYLLCECHDLDGTLINSKEDLPNVSQKLHKDWKDNDYDLSFLYESHAFGGLSDAGNCDGNSENLHVDDLSSNDINSELILSYPLESSKTKSPNDNLPSEAFSVSFKENKNYNHRQFLAYSSLVHNCHLTKEQEEALTMNLKSVLYSKIQKSNIWRKAKKNTVFKVFKELSKDMKLMFPLHCKNLHVFPQGSTFHGLRVKHGDEFDIHFRLGRPFLPRKICNAQVNFVTSSECVTSTEEESYNIPIVDYFINLDHLTTLMPGISIFLDNNNPCLVTAGKFHHALFSVIECFLNSYNSERRFRKFGIQSICMEESSSGALVTLSFKKCKKAVINLIFCIDVSRISGTLKLFSLPIRNSNNLKKKWLHSGASLSYLVPYDDKLWYADFNPLMKHLFSGKGCLRMVLQLLNATWEKGNWSKLLLKKYLLTVIVLQYKFCCEKRTTKSSELGNHFFSVLCLLKKCIEDRNLIDIFIPNKNLLSHLNEDDTKVLSDSIGTMIKCIKKDPSCVCNYL